MRQFGAAKAQSLCDDLEDRAKGVDAAGVPKAFAALESEIAVVSKVLRDFLDKDNVP